MQKSHIFFLILLVGLLLFSSCGKDNPSSSDPDSSENPDVVSKDIGPDGGEITSKDGKLTLEIPSGALGNMETITIEEIDPEDLNSEFDTINVEHAWELGPEGIQFEQLITVKFLSDQNPISDDTTLAIIPELLLTSNGGEVEALGNLIVEGNTDDGSVIIEGQLNHFSPLVDDKLEEYRVVFQVFGIPDQAILGETFHPHAVLKDPDGYVKGEPDPPIYHDLSTEPVLMTGEDKMIPMPRGDREFSNFLEYTCNGVGTGLFKGYTIVRGNYFRKGVVLRAVKNVECVDTDEELTADLKIDISFPEDPVEPGEEYVTTTYLENLGPDYAENVTFTLTLNQGEIIELPDNENAECQIGANKAKTGHQMACKIPEIVPEGTELNFSTIVKPEEAGNQEVTVEGESTTLDPNSENDSKTKTKNVEENSDSSTLLPGLYFLSEEYGLTAWEALAVLSNPFNPFFKDYSTIHNANFRQTLQQNEAQFGNLSGTFITSFAGANGFVVVDLATGEVLLADTADNGPFYQVAGASQKPPGADSPAMLLAAGQNGYVVDRFGQSGLLELDGTTYDTYPAGGDPVSDVVPFVQPFNGVGFFVYDDAQDLYVPAEVGFDVSQFGNKELISAYMHDDVLSEDPVPQPRGPFLLLTRETESGVYLAKWDGTDPVRAIDNIGFDARRLRCIENESMDNLICAASIFGHNRLGILTWDGENQPVLTDFAEVGDGPVGIDLWPLENGNILVVSTGFNDNTVTETEIGTNGRVISNTTRDALSGCQSPGHAIYIEDAESLKIVGTCYNSNNYFIMESEM